MTMKTLNLPGWVLLVSGTVTALATLPPFAPGLGFFVDLGFWPLDGVPGELDASHLFLAGIAGGVMAGWGASFLVLARNGQAERALLVGALTWYGVDSAASILAGAPMNALFNLGFLILVLWPLLPRRPVQASS